MGSKTDRIYQSLKERDDQRGSDGIRKVRVGDVHKIQILGSETLELEVIGVDERSRIVFCEDQHNLTHVVRVFNDYNHMAEAFWTYDVIG